MNRAARRRALRGEFKEAQRAKRLEARAHTMTPLEAREELAKWAAAGGHTQAEVDALNGKAAMTLNIRKIFKDNAGPGARYLGSEMRKRDGFDCVAVQFEMVPEGRKFDLDTVLRGEGDEALTAAVLKIADIARNIRTHIKPDEAMNGKAPG